LLAHLPSPVLPLQHHFRLASTNTQPDDLDYRVVQSDGVALFNVLQSLGVESRFLHFPDEGHWVVGRDNSLVWHTHIFNWIRYYVGLDAELITEGVIDQ
jgi:hypothetical protein